MTAMTALRLRTSVYFDYVPSKANIADLPSRDAWEVLRVELLGLTIHPAATRDMRIPHVGMWAVPLDTWVKRFLHLPGDWPS